MGVVTIGLLSAGYLWHAQRMTPLHDSATRSLSTFTRITYKHCTNLFGLRKLEKTRSIESNCTSPFLKKLTLRNSLFEYSSRDVVIRSSLYWCEVCSAWFYTTVVIIKKIIIIILLTVILFFCVDMLYGYKTKKIIIYPYAVFSVCQIKIKYYRTKSTQN